MENGDAAHTVIYFVLRTYARFPAYKKSPLTRLQLNLVLAGVLRTRQRAGARERELKRACVQDTLDIGIECDVHTSVLLDSTFPRIASFGDRISICYTYVYYIHSCEKECANWATGPILRVLPILSVASLSLSPIPLLDDTLFYSLSCLIFFPFRSVLESTDC